jgi:hypothetical protein
MHATIEQAVVLLASTNEVYGQQEKLVTPPSGEAARLLFVRTKEDNDEHEEL